MDQGGLPQNSDVPLGVGVREPGFREGATNSIGVGEGDQRKSAWINPVVGLEGLTEMKAPRTAWDNYLSRLDEKAPAQPPSMTVAHFVEKKFVPEHVAIKRLSGRTHYQAILKHVLTPEEVDRVFQVVAQRPAQRLKAIPDWPYLSDVQLHDARPDHVQRLISAAMARGYSTQTVTHIRNVVSVIFSHAKKHQCFTGDNPASQVTLPGMTRKEAHVLTLRQARMVLEEMHYPEREMTLIAILTGMNVAEICGLQWKRVNLSDAWSYVDGERIPPRTIAVRKQWYGGEHSSLGKSRRNRNLPISELLFHILRNLGNRAKFTGPDDFVLASKVGTPINQTNIAARRLKPIGREMQMPWLSWHVFHRTHTSLVSEFGSRFQDQIKVRVELDFSRDLDADEKWRCRIPIKRRNPG